jgi:hypothetical protein
MSGAGHPDFRASVNNRAVASLTGTVVLVVRESEEECVTISQLTAVVKVVAAKGFMSFGRLSQRRRI